jgi:hypothetical protein
MGTLVSLRVFCVANPNTIRTWSFFDFWERGFAETPGKLERAKGFEPSTPTLARLCSTPELRPLERRGPLHNVSAGRGEACG